MPEPESPPVSPPVLTFRDPVHMLAAIDPLLALAAVHPSAAVVAASRLLGFFSPAQNPAAALMAFQMGWDAACRQQQQGQPGQPAPGCDPGTLAVLALLGAWPAWSPPPWWV